LADPFEKAGYPALYEAADSASLAAQRGFLIALRLRLGGLLTAAMGAAIFLALEMPGAGGWVAVVGFLLSLMAEVYVLAWKPDRRWYEGRAAAESAKTLAWRYAVAGESFPVGTPDPDLLFVRELRTITRDLRDVDLAGSAAAGEQITPQMRAIRSLSFEERRTRYLDGRIEEQRQWYDKKAKWNRTRQHLWTVLVLVFEGLGLLGGILTLTAELSIDVLGVMAAIAATITAWVQAKQHSNLATAYGITAQELASARTEGQATAETDWPNFVGQAEEAVSREHTLWRATRGIRA
jgi:hypothetical protein